jgi:hypothetical protein
LSSIQHFAFIILHFLSGLFSVALSVDLHRLGVTKHRMPSAVRTFLIPIARDAIAHAAAMLVALYHFLSLPASFFGI